MAYCPNCGSKIEIDASACPKCNAVFGPSSTWQPLVEAPLDPEIVGHRKQGDNVKASFKNPFFWNKQAPWYDKTFFVAMYACIVLSLIGFDTAIRPSQSWLRVTYVVTPLLILLHAVYQANNHLKNRLLSGLTGWKSWALYPIAVLLFGYLFWFALAFGVPGAMGLVSSTPQISTFTILRKGQDSKCNTYRSIAVEPALFPKPLCLSHDDWSLLSVGDSVVIRGTGTWLGLKMEELFRTTGAESETDRRDPREGSR